MIIGSTQETAKNETRAALTPAMVKSYIKFGFKIIIESGLGEKSFITDNQFLESGAEIIHSASEIYQKANIIIKVNPPTLEEIDLISKRIQKDNLVLEIGCNDGTFLEKMKKCQ